MKVLIANPVYRRDAGNGCERYLLGSGIRFPWSMLKKSNHRPRFAIFPMFLGYTAALLEQENFEVQVIDSVPLNLTESEFEGHAINTEPDVIVFEPNSAVITDVLETANKLKKATNAVIVFVGTHVTSEYRDLISKYNQIDYIVRGEFEYGVLDLLKTLRVNSAAQQVAGVVWREADGQAPIKVGYARSVHNLNQLPLPARHLFPATFENDMSAYKDGFYQHSPAFDVHATRGCPYSCNFCAWVHVLYQNVKQRLRDPSLVVDEMEYLATHYKAKEIYFDDDNFSANRKFVMQLCDELIRRKSNIAWSALTDAIALNDGLLEHMAKAGCVGIKFGLDSADSDVLRSTNKPLKVSRVGDIVKQATKLGIKTHMTVVLGLSSETTDSLERTFEFACNLDIDSIQISIATPMPGTPLYEELKANHQLQFQQWDELDGYASTVIKYEHFTREYLENFVASAHTRWLRARMKHPKWLLRQIRYLFRLGAGAGIKGLWRRTQRFYTIVLGDSSETKLETHNSTSNDGADAHTPTVRW